MAHQATRPSLTDRYVWAATRGLPEAQRSDVEAELRTTIADMVDARVAAAGSPTAGSPVAGEADGGEPDDAALVDAETAALTELGDPERLAQAYRGRPDHLIGPAFYRDFVRLLRLLVTIVPAAAGGAVVLAGLLAGDPPLEALWSGVSVAFVAAVNVAFWTTLGFAVAERSGARPVNHTGRPWDPSRLPDPPSPGRIRPGDAIGSAIVAALAIAAVVWQRDASWFTAPAGGPVPFLNPAQWSFWIPLVLVVLAADIVLDLLRLRRGRWTVPLAVATTVLDLLLVVPFLGLLGSGPMVNPAFVAEVGALTGSATAGNLVETALTLTVVLVALVDVVEAWIGVRRAARARV